MFIPNIFKVLDRLYMDPPVLLVSCKTLWFQVHQAKFSVAILINYDLQKQITLLLRHAFLPECQSPWTS
jgi:hypothetical protein